MNRVGSITAAARMRVLVAALAALALAGAYLTLVPSASAAPGNDNFADRYVIPSTLPAEAEGSNVGATGEPGESVGGKTFETHQSVWWQWEAPETRLVTIGTCGTELLHSVVGIFTGEALSELQMHRVVPAGTTEGPGCGARLIFPAVAGTRYEIGVDSESESIPGPGPNGEAPTPPPTVGAIRLQIAPATLPSNDDFDDATPLGGKVWGGGGTNFFSGSATGYNFGATRQLGEPVHAGVGAGASVWFSWTPLESATATFDLWSDAEPTGEYWNGTRRAEGPVTTVYSGSTIDTLTPLASLTPSLSGGAGSGYTTFDVQAGRQYRIAIDGAPMADGEPWEGTFMLMMIEQIASDPVLPAPREPGSAAPAGETSAVESAAPTIRSRKIDGSGRKAKFSFRYPVPAAAFRCKLDRKAFRPCRSPYEVSGLTPGRHRLEVVATIAGGSASSPAVTHFTVPATR